MNVDLSQTDHSPRTTARFRDACRNGVPRATLPRQPSPRRPPRVPETSCTSQPARRDSRAHGRCSHPIAEPRRQSHTPLRPRRQRRRPQRPRWQVHRRHLRFAWPRLKETLDGLGNAPLKYVIDTHWHFDHTDNNANFHAAGATLLAHENTKKRMASPQFVPVINVHSESAPAEALPQETFASGKKLQANGETLTLQHFAPAHTDSDIYVHYEKANVIHMGDTFFNGVYPVIDAGTGGKMNGMIAAADEALPLANTTQKSFPATVPWAIKLTSRNTATCS